MTLLMLSVSPYRKKLIQSLLQSCGFSRLLCTQTSEDDGGLKKESIEDFLNESWKGSNKDENFTENPVNVFRSLGENGPYADQHQRNFSSRQYFIDGAKHEACKVLEILYQDGPGFDTKVALDDLEVKVSGVLVREVLLGILKTLNCANKNRYAKLGYKFFTWASQQKNYRHTVNGYHLLMKIFAECEEFKAMWRLVYEMTENGYPTTARTFNILICTCGEAGLSRVVIERFIKSKTFNFRPFKHSYNAILHSLLVINQFKLIEWVYQQMLGEGYSPDVLTYNVVLCAKFRLGKLDQFYHLLDEMGRNGFSPDFYTFNLLLRVLGRGDKPLAAVNLLNHMKDVGCHPTVLHYTTLIDGLSRAGNLAACKYFFDGMSNQGCMPDVVCYTVMITGYVYARELDSAGEMFREMIGRGLLPNVFTYHSMIQGFCMAGNFKKARSVLEEMESRGCNPNFSVYSTLVGFLRNAGKLREAHEVLRHMEDKGQYNHLLTHIKGYRRH